MSKWTARPGIDTPITTDLRANLWDDGYTRTLDARHIKDAVAAHEAQGWVRSKGKKSCTRRADNRYNRDGSVEFGTSYLGIKFHNPTTKGKSTLSFHFRINPGTYEAAIEARKKEATASSDEPCTGCGYEQTSINATGMCKECREQGIASAWA